MSAIKRSSRAAMRGVLTVELSLVTMVFLMALLAVMEVGHAVYLLNTVQEVIRRAATLAVVSDFSDPAVMAQLRYRALMRDRPGMLQLGQPVTDAHLKIDYLSLARSADGQLRLTPIADANLPACPARARLNCIADPNGSQCIRFVRVRLCTPNGNDCEAVAYQTLLPWFTLAGALPRATVVSKAESLGLLPGSPLCP